MRKEPVGSFVVACPYCIRPLGTVESAGDSFAVPACCPSCGSNPRRDAPITYAAAAYAAAPAGPCLRCGADVHALAVVCQACRRAPRPRVHDLDLQSIADKGNAERAGLARRWEKITSGPASRTSVSHFAVLASKYQIALLVLGQPGALDMFRRVTRANVLLGLHALNDGRETALAIQDGVVVTVAHDPEDDIDERDRGANKTYALWCAIAVGDFEAARFLAEAAERRSAVTREPIDVIDALLGALITPAEPAAFAEIVAEADAAVVALLAHTPNDDDDGGDDLEDRIVQLRALSAIAHGVQPELTSASVDVIDSHFRAWRYEQNEPGGVVSLIACAVARLASARGLAPLESPYAPRSIWGAPIASPG